MILLTVNENIAPKTARRTLTRRLFAQFYYDFCKNDYENQKSKTNTNLYAIIFMEVFGDCRLLLFVF